MLKDWGEKKKRPFTCEQERTTAVGLKGFVVVTSLLSYNKTNVLRRTERGGWGWCGQEGLGASCFRVLWICPAQSSSGDQTWTSIMKLIIIWYEIKLQNTQN